LLNALQHSEALNKRGDSVIRITLQWIMTAIIGSLMMASATAEVQSKQVRYQHNGAQLEGSGLG
jgi:hypothetical protein